MTPIRHRRQPDARETDFLLIDVIRAVMAQTWMKVPSHEAGVSAALCDARGTPDGNGIRIPDEVLGRDLTVATAGAGGDLVATQNLGYVPALQEQSVALRLGAQVEMVPSGGSVAIPRGATAAATGWLATEATTATDAGTLAFGMVSITPKLLAAHLYVSRQLLLQAVNAEQVIRAELRRAAAAALDKAIIQGTGASGQPLGIIGTSGIGGFTGTSLSQAALRDAQLDCAAGAEGRPLGLVTTAAVADVLARRARVASSDRMLWEGQTNNGIVEGMTALATGGCPTASAVVGDWSSILILQWGGGLVIELDPFTRFKQEQIGIRLLMPCDVAVQRPAAFSVASSIT